MDEAKPARGFEIVVPEGSTGIYKKRTCLDQNNAIVLINKTTYRYKNNL
jgi:hypothetical protein